VCIRVSGQTRNWAGRWPSPFESRRHPVSTESRLCLREDMLQRRATSGCCFWAMYPQLRQTAGLVQTCSWLWGQGWPKFRTPRLQVSWARAWLPPWVLTPICSWANQQTLRLTTGCLVQTWCVYDTARHWGMVSITLVVSGRWHEIFKTAVCWSTALRAFSWFILTWYLRILLCYLDSFLLALFTLFLTLKRIFIVSDLHKHFQSVFCL